jgi:hypothetical protein
VYCASSTQIDPAHFEATRRLAAYLVEANLEVVFGGGSVGLMGTLADTVLALGGRIVGVMPNFMRDVEWSHRGVTDFRFVETMHERKQLLLENTDGLVVLPGGCGTLEELLEAITLKRLGLFTQPIVILNTRSFYDPLRTLLDRCISERFMADKHREMGTFVDEPEEVLPALRTQASWDAASISFAAVR